MKKYKLDKEHIHIEVKEPNLKKLPAYFFFRKVSIPLVKLLLHTPIRPNHVTFFSIFLTLVRFALFVTGNAFYILLGALVMVFDKILDYTDGPLARCKNLCSLRGVFLDKVHHDFHFVTLFLGTSIGLFMTSNNIYYLMFGGLAAVFYLLSRNLYHYKCLVIYGNSKNPGKRIREKDFTAKNMAFISIVKRVVDFPRLYGDFIFYFVALINMFVSILPYYVVFYGIYTTLYFIPLFIYTSTFKEDKSQ